MDSENTVQNNIQNQFSQSTQGLVKTFNPSKVKFSFTPTVLAILAAALVLGSITGFMVSKTKGKAATTATTVNSPSDVSKGQVFGSDDTKTFKDQVEGILKEGGIEDEGAYHLVRPGGDSQNVYLTSSIVDLSLFLDRKVKVWGQTQKAQHAGWLMDVGRVEVLE